MRDSEKENRPVSSQQQENIRNIGVYQDPSIIAVKNAWGISPAKSFDSIDLARQFCAFDEDISVAMQNLKQFNISETRLPKGMKDTLTGTSCLDDDDFSSDDETEQDDVEKLTKQLEKVATTLVNLS